MKIDVIFIYEILNLLTANYLIFYLVVSFTRSDISLSRLLISAIIMTLYAVNKSRLLHPTILLEIIVNVIALLILKRDYSIIEFCKIGLVYVTVLVVTESFKSLLYKLLLPNDLLVSLLFAVSVLITALIFKIVLKFGHKKSSAKLVCNVEILKDGKCAKTKAYWDSGNSIYDKGVPVIVISNKLANKIALSSNETLAIKTVSGNAILPVTEVELKIYYDKKTHKLYQTKALISDKMDLRGYDVILHKEMEVQ
ncbi:MAG: sigma-E processing peptidase SpoIIGA [Clostridia bacterium]|nr:sigma-E processing peptidase SpoIIGA [Clostridia bacterium]MBO7156290.1 sigma-E processing peptidase SpoIIGA [Clostridia bacterium]